MSNVTIVVNGMSCGHCVASVEKAVSALGAIGKVDLQSKTVAIQFDETQLQLTQIKEAIEDQGYEIQE
jgi:copper chaperone